MGMKTLKGDEAFHFKNEGGKLKGAVLTRMDDFTFAGHEASSALHAHVSLLCSGVNLQIFHTSF